MIVSRSCQVVATFALVLAVASSGQSAELPLPASQAPVFLVIFDLRNVEPGEVTSTTEGGGPISLPISAIDDNSVDCADLAEQVAVKQLKGYVECALGHRLSGADFDDHDTNPNNDFPTVADRQRAAKAISA